ncbi:MAG: hypothetical protein IT428_00905 [Planctomycetaceae bacterium]|nr:hypothetical protein [Planctomycetaceae bacterium]
MTLSEFETAVSQALETGQVGVPLSLKVWIHRPGGGLEVAESLARLIERFVPMLRDAPATLLSTGADDGSHWQILLTGRLGRTALFLLSTSPASVARVQLLLIGNHGVLQLSGDSSLSDEPLAVSPQAGAWREAMEASRRTGQCVDVSGLLC